MRKSISKYFEADTERLDDLMNSFLQWKTRDYPRAREYFAAFRFGLQRHITWEEEVLFPLLERKKKISISALTNEMKLEHRKILQDVEEIERKLRQRKPIEEQQEIDLICELEAHNEKEEKSLYPAIARTATKGDVERAFREIEAMPDEKYFVRNIYAGMSTSALTVRND
jgi:iron-sulfur cluster repair protein YtfE (RIC family)